MSYNSKHTGQDVDKAVELVLQNSDKWGSGGTQIDTTLTIAGQAADAKVVGDKISKLSGEVSVKQDKSTLEADVAAKGFTKNTGTYSKPTGGIPKSDLDAAVQTSLGKADTALQEHQSLAAYRTAAAQDVIDSGKVDKVTGKGLSTNDYTAAAKAKVDAIPANPKYTDTVYDDTALKARVATIESKESAWDAKSDFSGSYNDLTGKPTIPTALPNPNALTIKIGSTTVTYDGSAAKTVEIADGSEVSY